jgi:MGT family glycosyltransferase
MKKHFAFTSMPAHGHVNPTLPLVEELVRRGHRVTYATHEKFADAVESSGATLLAVPGEMPSPPSPANITPEEMAGRAEKFFELVRTGLPPLLTRFEQDPPDALCYDMMTFTGRIVAEKLRLLDIGLLPTYASNEHFSLREQMVSTLNFEPYQQQMLQAFQKIQEFAAEHGIDEPMHPLGMAAASLNIVFIPREFQPSADTFDERFRFVGPSVGSRAEDDSWQPPTDSKPLLFISLGTTFNNQADFFRMCLAAFGNSPWHVAMAIGETVDPAELGPIPDNVEIRPYFPQPLVLRHADAFLSHAGMNSTMESLHAAVPMVAVPQMPEQELNAGQVEELGLGCRLAPSELSSELLRTSVEKVSADEQVRTNLAGMREIFHSAGGAVAAADAIEDAVDGR